MHKGCLPNHGGSEANLHFPTSHVICTQLNTTDNKNKITSKYFYKGKKKVSVNGWIASLPPPYVQSLISSTCEYEGPYLQIGSLEIKLRWGHTEPGWGLIQYHGCPYKKRGDTYTWEKKSLWRWWQRFACYSHKPRNIYLDLLWS